MVRLKGLPEDAKVYDVFVRRPEIFGPLTEGFEGIMRGPSPLTPGQRELIGAYVSELNRCPYCRDVHNAAVAAYGLDGTLVRRLAEDLAAAPIEEPMKPLLALVRKVTETPYKVTQADFDAAYDAGWDDNGIHDALLVTCVFNFMNRLVSGLGIEADDAYLAEAGPRIRDLGYSASLKRRQEQEPGR